MNFPPKEILQAAMPSATDQQIELVMKLNELSGGDANKIGMILGWAASMFTELTSGDAETTAQFVHHMIVEGRRLTDEAMARLQQSKA